MIGLDDPRLFNRQFLIGERPIGLPWKIHDVGPLRVSAHPNLDVTAGRRGDIEVMVLGYAFDTRDPETGMPGIVGHLLSQNDYEQLERALSRYCGRYVVIAKRGRAIRLYPDAVGQRSCFYGQGWAGSQPGLIGLMTEIRKGPWEDVFLSHRRDLSWPGTATPYEGIRMLRPNHYLDLVSMRSVRFWPMGPFRRLDVREAAENVVRLISAGMAGAHKRYRLYLALTAGHDSRVIFTSSREIHKDMRFFLIRDENTPPADVSIPPRLCAAYGLSFDLHPYIKPDREWLDLYDTNVCSMVWGDSRKKSKTYDLFAPDAMIVKGHVPSAGRATLYRDGYRYRKITPERLSEILRFPRNPVAVREFGDWLRTFPDGFEENLLDIYCLENRGGAWGSMECTGSDTNFQVFSPYNCRDVIENQLGFDRSYCVYPHRFNHIMADLKCPEISNIPMNPKTLGTKIVDKTWYYMKWVLRK
jgi:hypothetical protein